MKIAVTSHAVDRFRERVDGASHFEKESIRNAIRNLVEQAFDIGAVSGHPHNPNRRMIPFKSGKSVLYLSIGPNDTQFDAEVAVISVLYENEITDGMVGMGVSVGEVLGSSLPMPQKPENKFVVFVGSEDSVESYKVKDDESMDDFVRWRNPDPEKTLVYELRPGFLAR